MNCKYGALALFFVFGISACQQQNSTSTFNGTQKLNADGYVLQSDRFTSTITSTANLLPFESVSVKTPVEGNVLAIYFKEGEYVNKGDVIIQIDDRTWQAQLKGLNAQLIAARKELNRKEKLLEIEGASREEVDQLQATEQDLQARIDELEVSIDLAEVKAPFGGQLGMRNFSLGAYLDKGETITRLVQSDKIKVDFDVPAKYASYLQKGQIVQVLTNTGQDTARARIYAIDPMLNTASRSIQARALLNNPNHTFIAGNFAEVIVSLIESDSTLFIPSESLIPELNAHVVYKIKNGKAKRQDVKIGNRTPDKVEILNGLSAGDTVLVTGLMEVEDGVQVNIQKIEEEGSI
ncbi:MAG: efflux RND transporter periplasmic adaptor subunit [Bacteroidetes bacterium]|jgi:membrane fusion protein (multidrug efflux system)|nr:efflux RND transporter periplasmic adaptor subunit [Bacteroidota bacterium]